MSNDSRIAVELGERYVVHLEQRLRLAEAQSRRWKALVWFLTPLLLTGLLVATCLALHFSNR